MLAGSSSFLSTEILAKSESPLSGGNDKIGGAINSQSLCVHTEIVILMGAPVALPVQTNPLLALAIGVVDEPGRVFGAHGFPLHRARDERLPRRVAEYVERIGALGQHRRRAATDDDDRTACDRFLDDVTSHVDELLRRGPLRRGGRRHPLLRAHRHRGSEPLDQRWNSLFPGLNFRAAQAESRGDCVDYLVIE